MKVESPLARSVRSAVAFLIVLVLCVGMLAGQAASGIKPAKPKATAQPGDITKIQHIIFILKENRTFDTYFGTYPGADGATMSMVGNGRLIPLVQRGTSEPGRPRAMLDAV